MRKFFQNLALMALLMVLVVPQAPIHLRFLLVLLAICLPYAAVALKSEILKWQLLFTIYTIIVGAWYYLLYQDGTLPMVMGPFREFVIAALALVALRGRSPGVLLGFASVWILIQLAGLVDEHLQGMLWPRLPFPIASESSMQILQDGLTSREAEQRYGAFTFESSVVGGMAGVFGVAALAMLTARRGMQRGTWKTVWTVFAWLTIVGALAIGFLAKTKSGLFIMGGFVVPYLTKQVLTAHPFSRWRTRNAFILAAVVCIAGLLVFEFSKNEDLNNYIKDETDHFSQVLNYGILDNTEEGGLATRLAYFELTFQAFPYHPLGVGATSGYTFVKPVLGTAKITSEMDTVFAIGQYVMTSPFCLIIMYAGVIGLVLGWLTLRAGARMMCPGSMTGARVWLAASLFAYFIYINVVGISPYLAMFIFLVEAGGACNRGAPPRPPANGDATRQRLRRLFPQPKAIPVTGGLPEER